MVTENPNWTEDPFCRKSQLCSILLVHTATSYVYCPGHFELLFLTNSIISASKFGFSHTLGSSLLQCVGMRYQKVESNLYALGISVIFIRIQWSSACQDSTSKKKVSCSISHPFLLKGPDPYEGSVDSGSNTYRTREYCYVPFMGLFIKPLILNTAQTGLCRSKL